MRVQIIRLDPHDDIISARDKLAWSKAARLLLVWPDRGRILTRQLDLILLQRASRQQGGDLGLVTREPQVRANADALGIPVFSSITEAQRARWRRPGARPKISRRAPPVQDLRSLQRAAVPQGPAWQQSLWFRAAVFSIGLLTLIALAASFFPQARIEVQPITHQQTITLDARVDPSLTVMSLSGNLPGRILTAAVEGERNARATGFAEVANRYASGIARFTNLTETEVEIPAGTILQTLSDEPVKFKTTGTEQIAPGTQSMVDVPITALAPGRVGNLAAGRIQAVEGPLGLRLSVTNPQPLSGGAGSSASSVSANDAARERESLEEQLTAQALEQFVTKLNPGDYLLASTVHLSRVIEESIEPPVGQPATEFSLKIRAEYSAVYLTSADLDQLAGGALDANLPAGFSPQRGSLAYQIVGEPQAQRDGAILLKLTASRTLLANLPEDQIVQIALGLSPAEAAQRIGHELPLDSPARIMLSPAWWPRLPLFPFRIAVQSPDS